MSSINGLANSLPEADAVINCRYCYASTSCPTCRNLEFYNLLPIARHGASTNQRNQGRADSSRWIQKSKFEETAPTCTFCALLLDGLQIFASSANFTEFRFPFFEFELGESVSLVLVNNSFKVRYGLSPKFEFFTKARPYAPLNLPPVKATAIGGRPLVSGLFDAETIPFLESCLQQDTKPPSTLPRRLINVGEARLDSEEDVVVVNTRDVPVVEEYITLSHCWVGRRILTSTQTTIEDRMRGIKLADLPPVFRDAVHVCRYLSVKYLWIDSLCILQGDRLEWELEVSRMDEIYENAALTLSVQEDDENGFLPNPISHMVRDKMGNEGAIYVREVRTPGFLNKTGIFLDDKNDTNPGFVYARGWCYQERYLSTQILHFTKDEIFYESGNLIQCQCGNHSQGLYHEHNGSGREYSARQWRIIIKEYTQLAMTQKWDLLPGLAGIARRFSLTHGRHLGNFVAGMWSKDLVRWLCWKSMPQYIVEAVLAQCEHCRPWPKRIPPPPETGYGIPSFSWASRAGPCKFPRFLWNDAYRPTVDIVKLQYEADGRNRFGRVKHASVTLRGPVRRGFVYSTANRAHAEGECEREWVYVCDDTLHAQLSELGKVGPNWEKVQKGGWEICQDTADDIPLNGTEVLLLKMFRGDKNAVGDEPFDDVLGPDKPQQVLVSHMPEHASDTVSLVLLKTHDEELPVLPVSHFDISRIWVRKPTAFHYRRIGIAFLSSNVEFRDTETVILK